MTGPDGNRCQRRAYLKTHCRLDPESVGAVRVVLLWMCQVPVTELSEKSQIRKGRKALVCKRRNKRAKVEDSPPRGLEKDEATRRESRRVAAQAGTAAQSRRLRWVVMRPDATRRCWRGTFAAEGRQGQVEKRRDRRARERKRKKFEQPYDLVRAVVAALARLARDWRDWLLVCGWSGELAYGWMPCCSRGPKQNWRRSITQSSRARIHQPRYMLLSIVLPTAEVKRRICSMSH